MAAEGALSEALARIEHKVDLLLDLLAQVVGPGKTGTYLLTPVGDANHVCPVCTQPVGYQVDLLNKTISRKCGCVTGKQAPIDLAAFAAPKPDIVKSREESYGSRDQEDGNNTNRRGGSGRR